MPMAEYVELIDKYRINYYDSPHSDYAPPSYEWVDSTGEIVRCKDCKFWQPDEVGVVEMPICMRNMPEFTHLKDGFFFRAGPDDFCSLGERKGGDAE